VFVKVENVKGVLVPTQTLVSNIKKGTKTLLALNEIQVNTGLKDSVFSVQNLEQ
jgi:Outer membrane lipoprotein-sorting protein